MRKKPAKRRKGPKYGFPKEGKIKTPVLIARQVDLHIRRLGLTAAGLATRSGLHKHTVEKLLRGETKYPRPRTLAALAHGLGITPNDLLGMTGRSSADMREQWLVAEFRRLNPRQQDDLLEYLRDAADAEEGRARKRGVRRPEKDPPPKLIETVNPDSEREA